MANSGKEVTEKATAFVKKYKRCPSILELAAIGVTRNMMREAYGNLMTLHVYLAQTCEEIFDLELSTVNSTIPDKKRFLVTSAVTDSPVHAGFLKTIKNYCEREDAGLIIMASRKDGKSRWTLDPAFRDECIVLDDVALNTNVTLLGLRTGAKQVDPTTGLPRIGRRNGTFITASPKQRLKFVATGLNKLPHAIMSTGAITEAKYESAGILNDKANYLANSDHVMGAIIVELDEDETFHFRQVQANSKGGFIDLSRGYRPDGRVDKVAPAALTLGDWHSGETNEVAASAFLKLAKDLRTETIVLHDVFSGTSCSHWDMGKKTQLAQKALKGQLDLMSELTGVARDLERISASAKNILIVKSNHEEFLERYLQEARYVDDPQNHRLALDLAAKYMDGHNPVQHYVSGCLSKELNKKIRWLVRDESVRIGGVEVGQHGDKGANGARGSATALEAAHGDVVYGHTHTPEILRGAWCVGTTSELVLSYTSGASSWFHTSCIIYPNGQRQMINCVDGRLTTKEL